MLPFPFAVQHEFGCDLLPVTAPKKGAAVPEPPASHRLPFLGGMDGFVRFADVRAGWCDEGFAFSVRFDGKAAAKPFEPNVGEPDEADGVTLWLDARPSGRSRRAGRYCRQFWFCPVSNAKGDRVHVEELPIDQRTESVQAVDPLPKAKIKRTKTATVLTAFVPAGSFAGFHPGEIDRLGVFYLVRFRDDVQTPSLSEEVPVDRDPSLWLRATLAGGSRE
ncbi:MAG: hypothetical protein AAF532_04650 [Planctomycetota bacterium]